MGGFKHAGDIPTCQGQHGQLCNMMMNHNFQVPYIQQPYACREHLFQWIGFEDHFLLHTGNHDFSSNGRVLL